MADEYGDNDLRRLEREAEAARARLHQTIAEIKDPRTVENAKLEMKQRAEEVKEQVLGYIKGARDNAVESGRSQTSDFTRKLQRTAIENPLPIALIGAGIGWHLYKKPPITSALIGAGVWQLMKNWNSAPDERAYRDPYDPESPRGYVPGGVAGYGYDEVTDVASATQRVKSVATNLAYGAQDAVAGVQDAITGATDRVRDAVGMGEGSKTVAAQPADQMTHLGPSMADRAKEQAQGVTERAQDMAHQAQRRVGELAEDAQRRMQPVIDKVSPYLDAEHRRQLGMLMVLGGAGVLAGGLLRGSETGRRWMDEARDRMSESWEHMRESARHMPDRMPRRPVEDWRERASGAMSHMSDQAASMRHSAAETAGMMRERGAHYARSAQEMGSEHPLLLSAIGLAIGAVLGGMIRQTPFERETFGPMAHNLRGATMDTVRESMESMADRAGDIAEAVVESVTGGDKDDPARQAQAQRDRVNA